jgi:bifunctional UDP-N-acetylglucosamine pyrophosphorylase/glucosamine-1-phosphate N-acetyltransferase
VLRIVEHRDATPVERALREINCGIYCTTAAKLLPVLRKLKPDNAVGEYYLTDAVSALLAAGGRRSRPTSTTMPRRSSASTPGPSWRAPPARFWGRMAESLMDEGVTLLDPSRTWIDPRARVGRDTVIWPGVLIEGRCVIGEDCEIRSGARLSDATLGQGVRVLDHCVVEDSRLADGAVVGPFAYLRHGTVVEERAKVGTFVETKKTRLGRGSKAPHLSYLGDAEIGPDCNIGAGTITCNYDGVDKHPHRDRGRGVRGERYAAGGPRPGGCRGVRGRGLHGDRRRAPGGAGHQPDAPGQRGRVGGPQAPEVGAQAGAGRRTPLNLYFPAGSPLHVRHRRVHRTQGHGRRPGGGAPPAGIPGV